MAPLFPINVNYQLQEYTVLIPVYDDFSCYFADITYMYELHII